jgi:DivIVA domain-containing protein
LFDPESIRNASFTLLPTGYNPEHVDTLLDAIATRVEAGEPFADLVDSTEVESSDVGYAPEEVADFLAALADHAEDVAADAELDEVSHAPESSPSDHELADADEAAEIFTYAAAPEQPEWQPESTPVDLQVLGQAVHRTSETLGSLQSFIDNEISAMKLAVERQAQETALRCETLLSEAAAEAKTLTDAANAEISRARKEAERENEKRQRELAKQLKQMQADADAAAAKLRSESEEYAAETRAAADRDRQDAQRTIENAISMQSAIAESLERARQQLTPDRRQSDIAA